MKWVVKSCDWQEAVCLAAMGASSRLVEYFYTSGILGHLGHMRHSGIIIYIAINETNVG